MEFIRKYIILCVALTNVNWTCVFSEKVSCPAIKVPNLRARFRSKGRIVNFQCKNKFQLIGVKFAVCLDSGEWSQQHPICVGTTCQKPDLDPNTLVKELYKGGVLKFSCGAGLIRSGPETLMCDGKDWSDQPPKCIEGSTLQCDFEDPEICGWSDDFDDNFDWAWHKGETPTANTGPRFDHTTNSSEGHYMYMESSGPQTSGQTTRLLSPPYSHVNTINMCLEFFYHMYGPDGDAEVGDLDVYVKPLALKTTMLQLSQRIFHQSGNQGDQWLPAVVHLPLMDFTFQIVFQATRRNSWSADIAIDDVRLYNCAEETTTSSGPTEVDETDDEDHNQEVTVQKTTDRRPQTTPSQSTHSATTVRTTLLPTTDSTPAPTASTQPTIASTQPTTTFTQPTTASTQTTKRIVTVVTTEATTTRRPTTTATSPTPTRPTESVAPPVVRTTATTTTTTLRSTKTPTSESSTSTTTTRTTTTMPLKTTPKQITTSTETTTSTPPASTSTRATTPTVKLTKPTTAAETSSTSTTTSTTKTTRTTTTPVATTGITSAATLRTTTVESTSVAATNPPSTVHVQATTYTDNSPTAKVVSSTTAVVDTTDWSTPKSHVSTGFMPSTTGAKDTDDDTGTDDNNADVYEYENENPTTPNESDQANDNDEDYQETTKSMSSSADETDYDLSSDNLEPGSTFNKSSGRNDSHTSTSDNESSSEDDENKSSLTENGKSLSNSESDHRAVKGETSQSSSSSTDVLPLIIGVAASVLVAALVIAILAYLWARNQRRKQEKEQEDQMNIITEYVETNLSTQM